MKNQRFLLLLLFPCLLQAQENCQGSFTEYYLNSNNIRASFFPRGNKFTDGERGGFLVPYPSPKRLSTIFASSVWVAGFDDAGNYKLAAERYPSYSDSDFSVGPLTTIGTPYDTVCGMFDRAWSVFREDVYSHMADYYEDSKIDDTIPAIFGWPGRGNKYFARFNGFELPHADTQGFADFFDLNANTIYDPDQGEYPVIKVYSNAVCIPDQILWMVYNDVDANDTMGSGSYALRFEIQLTAFAFHCQENTFLNNTIFNKYKIINRTVTAADSVFFGLWTDYDLGCSDDDFMGSDSARSTEFIYNADQIDGNDQGNCSTGIDEIYNDIPPIQSMTWVSHPMYSFIEDAHSNGHVLEKYRLLNGMWADGTPLRPEKDGYDTNSALSPTRFLYNGDPRDTSSWSAINVVEKNWDHKSVSSVFLDRLDPGYFKTVMTAYMYHHDQNAQHLDQITNMYDNIDSLINLFNTTALVNPCFQFSYCTGDDCVWPGDFDNNGIADHRDYLMWGVMNGSIGPERNGQISWRGHPGDNWSNTYADINAKHGDGDGNGKVDLEDIQVNDLNFTLTNRFYDGKPDYPKGPEIILSAKPFFNDQGSIEKVNVSAGQELHNVLGLTFEIEFDTALFYVPGSFFLQDNDTSRLYYHEDLDHKSSVRYSFVKKDHSAITINAGWSFFVPINNMIRLKPGLPVPDSTIIRLRNLKAIDAEGNDLHFGSEPIVIYKEGFVGIHDPAGTKTVIYPNPSSGFIQIETAIESEAQLFSLHGQLVRQLSRKELERPVDVSALPPGMYILRIMATGESIKVIVQ